MAPLPLWSEKVMIRPGERASDARIHGSQNGLIAADSKFRELPRGYSGAIVKNTLIVVLGCGVILGLVACNQSKHYSDRWFYVSTDLESEQEFARWKASWKLLPSTA